MENKQCNNMNEIVVDYYDYIHSFINKKLKNKEDVDDLTQEVMVKLTEACSKPAEIQNLKAWLFQVARNVIYSYYQSHKLDTESLLEETSFVDHEQESIGTADYIISMINLLPKEYGEPLKWADIDGLSQQQIADKLGIGLSGAKMRIQRARKKLLELFNQCCDIEYDAKGNFVSCSVNDSCESKDQIKLSLENGE
ncbi:sigma-70 family RNA polymerase sigma factor [Flammeovirga kamogawensis]|uniref:Sigma-70 family RNA polymerase sigma factor n=1 Tax=Flammeovirga kamogawensis TaxID=373891 RepID=A0ABX8GVC6_9BACT|nr:sigma-70 family RNA polymerase sigma factor [Flammeovirga kamogawensis]MBB6459676.1 RNA polymerase sigma-70 factor (ECF subfamily) [Flammeovirga kamogawensis]QWG07262.1 sigma-70 family RNA polymerase sigma factor [Flammeovirga kamogawensis]TRX69082.1 sigma-70 family RNA polymerase sigma factor [Flammeovirga kamogawensis]